MSELLKEEEIIIVPITNDLEADKAIANIRESERQYKVMKDWYKEALSKIEAQMEQTKEYEMTRLRKYFDTVPHHETKTQDSYALPSGKLILKTQEPEWIHDEDELIKWAEANGEEKYVKVEKHFDWAGLKKKLEVLDDMAIYNSKVVPGVTVKQRDLIFTIGK